MRILDKIISFIKNIFHKEKIKTIEEIKSNIETKEKFIKSLKINSNMNKKKIKTLIFEGNGLGIKKDMKY